MTLTTLRRLLTGGVRLGQVLGITVRLDLSFLLLIGLLLALGPGTLLDRALFNLILFGSVFLHELGHCCGARWVGGSAHEIRMWPLGGLAALSIPSTARAELITTAAGPLVNLALWGLAIGALQLLAIDPLALFQGQSVSPLGRLLSLVGLVNFALFVFNVLPSFPMDGGKLLRSLLCPLLGWRPATLVAAGLGLAMGVVYALGGFVYGALLLALIGLFVVLPASWQTWKLARRLGPVAPPDDALPHERNGQRRAQPPRSGGTGVDEDDDLMPWERGRRGGGSGPAEPV